jgi:hypothetical protein
LRHDISRTFGRASPQVGKLKPFVEQERERSFAYRLMETIRNHAQHQGLPIGGLKYSMGRVEDGASVWVRRTVRPSLDVGGLEADRNVRRDMIRELELADADGDFSLWVREYMDSLRRIHGFVRGLFADDVLAWEGTLRAVIARSHEAFGEELIGLAAVGINNDGAVEQEAQVFADLLQRRRTLVARNRVDGNRAHCYVSGRPPKARS